MDFASIRVLVAEDMEEMRSILVRLLQALGFKQVRAVRNGEEAWLLLQQVPDAFDLVLCDWNMPRMTGRELLERVRSDAQLAPLPFVMITGENSTKQVHSAISGGVTDFILKPFSAAQLEARITRVLNQSDAPPGLQVLPPES
ncbi:response regulator [Hydrogenophaga defluvii]|uniref:Response regulator n=1 Tax=Hydrogenophaga defluvii TaxID=249410 RepID=A0ABW2S7V4_9BURK